MSKRCKDCVYGDDTDQWCHKTECMVKPSAALACPYYVARKMTGPVEHTKLQIIGCHSADNHCPFCHEFSHSGQTWCVLEDSMIKDAEDMWDKAPSWCPLRRGPVTIEWKGAEKP